MKPHEAIEVAVVIERTAQPNAWQDWSFRLAEVLPHEAAFGIEPRCLHDDGKISRWLHPAWRLELFPDECKGYFLNLTSGKPVWFVFWVPHESDPAQVVVSGVSVSYIEADRRMTAEEVVENLPLEDELCEWLRVYTNTHFRPDTGRKVRAQSFLSPEDRDRQDKAAAAAAAGAEAAIPPVGADPGARNAALRKLFHSDPHFKQSDGLDVSIDEVVQESSSPLARQRKIQQARAMGLLDDELQDQAAEPGHPGKPPAA
jgi:Protein of unknown function (DUF3305)/Protein of unknown function (DUF3306)